MGVCEKCWAQASWEAATRGGFTAEIYRRLLDENETKHAAPVSAQENTNHE